MAGQQYTTRKPRTEHSDARQTRLHNIGKSNMSCLLQQQATLIQNCETKVAYPFPMGSIPRQWLVYRRRKARLGPDTGRTVRGQGWTGTGNAHAWMMYCWRRRRLCQRALRRSSANARDGFNDWLSVTLLVGRWQLRCSDAARQDNQHLSRAGDTDSMTHRVERLPRGGSVVVQGLDDVCDI